MSESATDAVAPKLRFAARPYTFAIIAETGGQFADFAPCVPSLNDTGTVAFQAALTAGGTGVFTGAGGPITARARGSDDVGDIASHPDIATDGAICFYTERADGYHGVFLARTDRLVALADTRADFATIGPLGPTMNNAGAVAFRATSTAGSSGIFTATADGDGRALVRLIADQSGPFSDFTGLPVATESGAVVFRADRKDGGQGIYRHDGRSLTVVAEADDADDAVDNKGLFTSLGLFPSANQFGAVAFSAVHRDAGPGIFAALDGQIVTLADARTGFASYRGALVSDDSTVVFYATPPAGQLGIYAGPDPVRDRIIGIGDPFQGAIVTSFVLNPVSINRRAQLALRVLLDSGRHLIVRADPT